MIPGHVWSRNFPKKIYIFEHRYMVRRYSWGWGWVRMGAGGCISTQQTQKKGLVVAQDIIVDNRVRGEHEFKDGAATIWTSQSIQVFFWDTKGVAGGTYVSINKRDDKRARNNKKKVGTNKSIGNSKVVIPQKQHRMSKKEREREQIKQNKKQNTEIYSPKLQRKKNQAERTKNCAKRRHILTKNLRQQTVQWWNGWNKSS